MEMDWRLKVAVLTNDTTSFMGLVQGNVQLLEQRTANSLNTVLHMAVRLGNFEMVMEILKLKPAIVAAENKKLETSVHEACRNGDVKVLMQLLQVAPYSITSKINCENQDALFIACSYGHLDVVNLLLDLPWFFLEVEDGDDSTCLHVAALKGHTDITTKLLERFPDLARKTDKNGFIPLHCACSRGHFEVSKLFLRLDPDLAMQYDHDGYSPVHLAAMNGNTEILEEFILIAPTSFKLVSREQGETVFHLAVRFDKLDAFVCLAKVFHNTHLFHQADNLGNTVSNLLLNAGRNQYAEYISQEAGELVINHQNGREKSELNIATEAGTSKVGYDDVIDRSECSLRQEDVFDQLMNPSHDQQQLLNSADNIGTANVEVGFSISKGHQSNIQKKKSPKNVQKRPRQAHWKIHTEALQNGRSNIIIVAVLIATVTYSEGLNPPGGVYQDGPLKGKAIMGKTRAFKVFSICNNIALFISLCTVIILVSIIPFKRNSLTHILTTSHKVMWVSLAFMAASYAAGTWTITPEVGNNEFDWTIAVLISLSVGTLGVTFFGLGVMYVRHRMRVLKWVQQRKSMKRKKSITAIKDNQSVVANYSGVHSFDSVYAL